MMLYQKICDDNIVKYGTESQKYLRIIINQYSDRTHFLYELLQNAEDAGANHIRFHLTKQSLEIYHDGRPFDEKDIRGICGVADGTKEDGTRIGHFGIGFKSVYCYTLTPQIYSGDYHFKIHDQLFPEEIQAKPELPYEETCMILPFDKEEVSSGIAYEEIKNALTGKINADSILMLQNIEEVTVEIAGYPDTIQIAKMKNRFGALNKGSVYALGVTTTAYNVHGTSRKQDVDYLCFSDGGEEAVALLFRTTGQDGKQLCAVRNSKVYAFFPTAKESHLNFYIHAPFDTTPARDNFKEGAEYGKHNVELVSRICDLIWDAFEWMKEKGYLSFSGFNTVFPMYEYEKDDLLYAIYENSIGMIAGGMEILPTNQPGVYKAVDKIYMPPSYVIVDTFDDDDLHRLISSDRSWLAKEISTEEYRELRCFLKRNADIKTLEWKDLVLKMDEYFLQQKSIAWLETLMGRIESCCVKRGPADSHYMDVTNLPLVRVTGGRHIRAKDREGHLQVYLNNPDFAAYKIEQSCLENDTIRRFYQTALRIPSYNIERKILDDILPKYRTKQVEFKSGAPIEENIEDLKMIRDALLVNSSLLEKVAEAYIVTDGREWYRPAELYIPSKDTKAGYALLREHKTMHFLSERYTDGLASMKLTNEFFRKIGCSYGIRKVSVTSSEYLRAVNHYCGAQEERRLSQKIFSKQYQSEKPDWSFSYESFPEVFQNMTKEKSIEIARFLNPNVAYFDIKGNMAGADDKNFSGKNVDSCEVYTMIGLQLCFEKWIYVEGNDAPQRPIDVDRETVCPEYKVAGRLFSILPFKELKNAMTEWVNENFSDATARERIKTILSHPDELEKMADALARSKAKEEARKAKSGNIREMIKNGRRAQQGTGETNGGLEIEPISEKAKARREENLDEILRASLKNKIGVTRGLQFTSRTSSEEERQFLLAEYEGICQICGGSILRYDGKPYFEAINVIKFSQMMEEYAQSSDLGWNSLCLCPNCAARYNYCSKDISTLYNQVMGQEVIPDSELPMTVSIQLPEGTPTTIQYTPRHFLALQRALRMFSEDT